MGYVAEISASLQHCAGVAALSASVLEKCAWGSAFLHIFVYVYIKRKTGRDTHSGAPAVDTGGEGRDTVSGAKLRRIMETGE